MNVEAFVIIDLCSWLSTTWVRLHIDCSSRYLFLVERVHALRAPFVSRTRDVVWILSTVFIIIGFGAMAPLGMSKPLAKISAEDGKCRIGLPRWVTIPLLTLDMLINTGLTLTFVYLLNPVIHANNLSKSGWSAATLARRIGGCCGLSRKEDIDNISGNPRVAKSLERLLWRTFAGSCAVMIPTIGNLGSVLFFVGDERGFVCLILCTFDGMSVTAL